MAIDPTKLIFISQAVLDTVCDCLEQSALGVPSFCYLSHNEPPDDCCDFASVWVERVLPSHGFADGQYVTGGRVWGKCGDLTSVLFLAIRVVRPCFPVMNDDSVDPFPSPEDIQNATEGLLQDAWILNCCVPDRLPEAIADVDDCLEIGIGDITPHGPEGGCAGWTMYISVESPRCC